jgi:hypothetical protein
MPDVKATYSYGQEKLYLAVNFLATGTGPIQERLASVATSWLGLPASFPDLLPADLMSELKAVLDELTKVHGEEGAIRETARAMSDEEGAELAKRVLSLYLNLRGGI